MDRIIRRTDWIDLARRLTETRAGDWIDRRKVPECNECNSADRHFCDLHLKDALVHFWPSIAPTWGYDFEAALEHYRTTASYNNGDPDSTSMRRDRESERQLEELIEAGHSVDDIDFMAISRSAKDTIPKNKAEDERWYYLVDFLIYIGACEDCLSRYSDKVDFSRQSNYFPVEMSVCRPCYFRVHKVNVVGVAV